MQKIILLIFVFLIAFIVASFWEFWQFSHPKKYTTGKTPKDYGFATDKSFVLGFVPFLHQDYNLLLFDFRYFGESQGKSTSFGFHEHKDLQAAVKFLKERKVEKIGILSFSLGASIALLASPKGRGFFRKYL